MAVWQKGRKQVDSEKLLSVITGVLERAPQWVRDDLAVKDPGRRSRAEESLAAMIVAALREAPSAEL